MDVHTKASTRLIKDVLAYCRDDAVTQEVAYDDLCILYGNRLCQKYRHARHNMMIRGRLREIGRFILEIKKHKDVNNLRAILCPGNYDLIYQSINRVAGFDETSGKYKAPSTAYNLGLHIKMITNLLHSECIKEGHESRDAVRDLISLMNEGFPTDINKTVNENQCENKRHKKVVLPTADDIEALKKYLENGRKNSYNSLMNEFNYKVWKDLAGYTLISLQLFNRRQAGELERILIEDYKS